MPRARLPVIVLLAAILSLPGAPRADEGGAALETVFAAVRTARAYLRTGNADLAALELDRLAAEWPALAGRLRATPPAQLAGQEGYAAWVADTGALVRQASEQADAGQAEAASATLAKAAAAASAFRRSAGWHTLGDAVEAQSEAMQALLRAADSDTAVADAARAHAAAFRRCDEVADPVTRADPQFRRIVDGALASLDQVPETVRDNDVGRLRRILIELRSYDRLLAFRWG